MTRAKPLFRCERLNASTFVILENDKYGEHPLIYVKRYTEPKLLVLTDTGCGSGDSPKTSTGDLRDYIENVQVLANAGAPLNPRAPDGRPTSKYLVIGTHCHYDHILGLPQFCDDSVIVASSIGRWFVENDLPEHSLCNFLGIKTPAYKVSHWAEDYEDLSFEGPSLDVQILHTPGHTPDELAWYDKQERHLFVGDSFYERVSKDRSSEGPIVFPKEGSIIEWLASIDKLLRFVERKNAEPGKPPVKIACGHLTSSVDGHEILLAVRGILEELLAGKLPVKGSSVERGEEVVLWQEEGEPRFSVRAPRRLVDEARRSLGNMV